MAENVLRDTERPASAFTLVEVLLVMLITSVLVLGLSRAYRQARQLWSTVEGQRQGYYVSRSVMEGLRAELVGLYLPPAEEGQGSFTLVSQSDGSIELVFYSLSPAWRTEAAGGRSAMIRYQFTPDSQTGESVLERSETLCAGESVIGEPVSGILMRGEFRFCLWASGPEAKAGESSWKASYESRESPPKAMKVTFEFFKGRNAPSLSFTTLLQVPCESPLQEGDQRGDGAL